MANYLLANSLLATYVAATNLELSLSNNGASFSITHDGAPWLSGTTVNIDGASISDKTLITVNSPISSSGTDAFGKYNAQTVSFAKTSKPTNIIMNGIYKTYLEDAGMIVFTQSFPEMLIKPIAAKGKGPSSTSPACRVVAKSTTVSLGHSEVGYIAYTPYHLNQIEEGQGYDRHDDMYCSTIPIHTWTHTGNETPAECQALCDKMECACFDILPTSANELKARTIFPGFDRPATVATGTTGTTGTTSTTSSTTPHQRDLDCFAYHNVS